ncbi:M23 family metallopeptidase [Massilia sp. H6]|uniref:M23 family metallopeptidase n=1 Tax=Massilia sp. H6 TaxID=2970464 RepID=UPI00216997C6|nr:M23 family metallopeptidase [Massilia sp. H6]UVW27156.1 M23 family metallopeptidase [Massilia sp. H6]
MRIFLRSLLLAVLLIAAWGLAGPWLRHALYAMRLSAMPAPTVLAVPVEGVAPGRLRDTWHAARGNGRRHEGIDIFARRGTAVRAATEGIVLRTGESRLGGKVVWMMGPGGQRHYYAHLDGYADVAPGMRVEQGRVLGYVGNTGNAAGTPPHLHYGVYGAGGALNPFPLLRAGAQR